ARGVPLRTAISVPIFISLALLDPVLSRAASFSTDFNSGVPAGATLFGNAFVDTTGGVGGSGVLKLTANAPNQQGAVILDDLDHRRHAHSRLSWRGHFHQSVCSRPARLRCSIRFGRTFRRRLPGKPFH